MVDLDDKAQKLTEAFMQLVNRFHAHESEIVNEFSADLTVHDCKCLNFLKNKGPSIMKEISEYMGVAVSTMTGMVDRMVNKGLVVRERPEEDRRSVKVQLTELGEVADRWHFEEHMRISRAILGNLSEADQDALISLLQKVLEGVESRAKAAKD
ncbi:MAG TPA: MarR family transcriptional regulator [bacterium]|jgi:DNA-binding MarR family transcriptional regulator